MRKCFILGLLLAIVATSFGCARAARDTTGFTLMDSVMVEAPMAEAWEAARAVLLDMDVDLYTRDKRGVFVAYSHTRRRMLVPYRQRHTVLLQPEGANATRVTVETIDQVYGVTLLTHPDWHDRKTTDGSVAQAIIEALQERLAGSES